VEDDGDSWGADRWSYRQQAGEFSQVEKSHSVLHDGPISKATESKFVFGNSTIVQQIRAYTSLPVLEYRIRIQWNEERKRLKLSVPTVFTDGTILCEIPGGAVTRLADGQEHVQGRWCLIGGERNGTKIGFAVVNSGQNGYDFQNGELRLSVLRSAAYCHEQSFALGEFPSRKFMDQGVHDIRLLVTAGDYASILSRVNGLADWLNAPPFALAHLPIGSTASTEEQFLSLAPTSLRILACKQSWDGKALIVRMQESTGMKMRGSLSLTSPQKKISLIFAPFEIKTIRIERNGTWRLVNLIEEK
jgi:alpha-mannosidase